MSDEVYWYHGSKKLLPVLKKQKALALPGRPLEESLEAIYFTPNFAFALACASRPPGVTEMDLEKQTIRFGNPDAFDPDALVYVYYVDPKRIPEDQRVWIDQWQVAVTMDEIKPDKVETYEASEVSRYYQIVDKESVHG